MRILSKESMMPAFTPVQKRILDVLNDGLCHPREELRAVIDVMATLDNLHSNLSWLRKRLRPIGHDIICEYKQRNLYYRHVVLLAPNWRD